MFLQSFRSFKEEFSDFPGGAVVKNRGHRFEPWSGKIPHAMEQLSLPAATTEAHAPRARAPQQEKPPRGEAHAPQQRVASAHCN